MRQILADCLLLLTPIDLNKHCIITSENFLECLVKSFSYCNVMPVEIILDTKAQRSKRHPSKNHVYICSHHYRLTANSTLEIVNYKVNFAKPTIATSWQILFLE